MSVFHEGEIAVQVKAGARHRLERVGNGIHSEIPEAAQEFLDEQRFVIVGAAAEKTKDVWATVLFGSPGFAHCVDETTVYLAALPITGDPLKTTLTGKKSVPVDLLAIEPATRQVYANCPKYIYIQHRSFAYDTVAKNKSSAPPVHRKTLTAQQVSWIEQSDTFFIASTHPDGGADASPGRRSRLRPCRNGPPHPPLSQLLRQRHV